MGFNQMYSDPIDEFLTRFPTSSGSEELRLGIQNKTLAVIRRRRLVRQVGWLTGLAACYGAGILTLWIFNSSQPDSEIVAQTKTEISSQADKISTQQQQEGSKMLEPPDTALALEWQAWDSETRRPELFRLAGDKYLQTNDLESATRCYRGALRNASEKDLQVTLNDSWLLMSLKEAKQEESRYAKLISP